MCASRASASTSSGCAYSRSIRSRTRRSRARSLRCCSAAGRLVTCDIVPCGGPVPIGAPGFEPGTSPTRTVRATRLRHAPKSAQYRPALRAPLARDRRVVPAREARDEGLEGALERQVLARRPALEAHLLDLLAVGDHVVDEVRVAVAEERADGVQARVGQRLEERPGVVAGGAHPPVS